MIEIPLTQGHTAIVDDCDADLADLKWCALVKSNTVYGRRAASRRPHISPYLHREVLQRMIGRPLEHGETVDHINGDGRCNLRSNLRLATQSENMRNKRLQKNSTTGLKGVAWNSNARKWQAKICINRQQKHLGYFDTPEAAHKAYTNAAIELSGSFAHDGTRPLRLADAPIATKQLSLFAELDIAS
jgi:hypothetical protein